MALSAEHLEVLRFVDENGGTATEDALEQRVSDQLATALSLVDDGYLVRHVIPLHETQTPETARMPPAEAVVYSLTDAGRNAIAK